VPRPGEAQARIEREIAGEKAAALGRAGERLEAALHEAHEIAARLATAPAAEQARLGLAYEQARTRAQAARVALVIQREAVGLRQHRVVDQAFPEPPPLSALRR
jgi:hypothetical protein